MKATELYRITAALLFVAAVGHTSSLLRFWQVAGSISTGRFPGGHGLTYAQIILGLGLFCSLCVLFGVYLAWHLGTLARNSPQAIGALGWLLFAYQLVGIYISFNYLSGLVRILSVVTAVCAGLAAWLSTGAPHTSVAAKAQAGVNES